MVEDYRKTLVTYAYQEDLLKEHLSQKISDEESWKNTMTKTKKSFCWALIWWKESTWKFRSKPLTKKNCWNYGINRIRMKPKNTSKNTAWTMLSFMTIFMTNGKIFWQNCNHSWFQVSDSRQFLEQHKTYEGNTGQLIHLFVEYSGI